MKKLLYCAIFIVLFNACSWKAWAIDAPIPETSGYVTDTAGIITLQDQATINAFATELESKTTAQLAVVSVPTTQPETIEQYAVRLFKKWGIGQKGKDNGVLFLIAAKDHQMRIEVGYGLEGVLTDAMTSAIIHQMAIPQFKQGHMSQGVLEGSKAIISLIAKEHNVTITGEEKNISNNLNQDNSALWVIVFVFILLFFFFTSSFKRTGVGIGGYYGGGGFGGGSSGGGGFGGFGGGGSGGGGSSGGW